MFSRRTASRIILRLLVVLLSLTGTYEAHAELSDRWDQQYPGIFHLHRYGTDTNGVRQNYHIAIIDLQEPSLHIKTLLNRDTWKGAKETVRGMATRNNAALAVNGNYWNWGTYDPSQGTTAVDGFCYRAHPERSALAMNRDRTRVEIGRYGTWPIAENPPDDCPAWFDQAIGAGPQFLFQGELRWESSPNPVNNNHVDINGDTFFGPEARHWGQGRDPNTAAAITADGRTLLLMTCDGRNAGGAGGCRVANDMAQIFLEFGASDALKLDSGGSTTFYYAGDVINRVSEGSERAVVDALGVFSPRLDQSPCTRTLSSESTTVISHTSECFTRSGTAWWMQDASLPSRSWYTWTISAASDDSLGQWTVKTGEGGWYHIEAFIPELSQLSEKAGYTFKTSTEWQQRTVHNLEQNKGHWLRIGTFDLPPNETLHIALGDNTGEEFFGQKDPRSRRLVFERLQLFATTTPSDAGTPEDAEPSITVEDDASTEQPDSTLGGSIDAASKPEQPTAGEPDTGCGCKSTGQGQAFSVLSFLVFCLMFYRIRRRSILQ